MLARIGLIISLASIVALSGCGRKGPLEPPPGVGDQKPIATTGPRKSENSTAPDGLFRNTTNQAEDKTIAPTTTTAKARSTGSFVLDPLLQ